MLRAQLLHLIPIAGQGAYLVSSLPSCLPPGGPSSQMPKHISLQGPLKVTWVRSTGPQPIKHVQCPMLASPSMSHIIIGRPVPVCCINEGWKWNQGCYPGLPPSSPRRTAQHTALCKVKHTKQDSSSQTTETLSQSRRSTRHAYTASQSARRMQTKSASLHVKHAWGVRFHTGICSKAMSTQGDQDLDGRPFLPSGRRNCTAGETGRSFNIQRRANSLEKTLMLGKIEGRRRRR